MTGDLLQSDGWERFQRALGRKTERIVGVLAIETPMPFGFSYFSSPRGSFPYYAEHPPSSRHSERPEDARNLTHVLQDTAKATGAIFWRAEFDGPVPGVRYPMSEPRVMRRFVEPEWTWRTSLTESDTTRMVAMHEKHRYNVRLAERKGVTVRMVPPPHAPPPGDGGKEKEFLPFHRSGGGVRGGGDFEMAWSLLQETAKRQGISTHPRRYYETMLRELPRTTSFIAEREGTPLAVAIVAYHGDTATYLHGGSSYDHRALMAPHLLHWQAMRGAKAAGMRWYDWGGIQPETQNAKHKMQNADWTGISRFKQGFGGEAVHHPPTVDFVFRRGWYAVLSALAMMRTGR